MSLWRQVDGLLLRVAADHADKVRDAIASSVNVNQIVEQWFAEHPNGHPVSPADARAWARLHIRPNGAALAAAIRLIHADGWVLGDDVATVALTQEARSVGKSVLIKAVDASFSSDWDNWKPGNRGAALLVDPPGGLASLLAQGNAEIAGLNETLVNRIGTHLADSLGNGQAADSLARLLLKDNILNTITDPARAQAIAITETSRALNYSALDLYKQNEVEQVSWLALQPCDLCETNAAAGPVKVGASFPSGNTAPPAHPHCRCTLLPIIDTGLPVPQPAVTAPAPTVGPIVAPAKPAPKIKPPTAEPLPPVVAHPDLTVKPITAPPTPKYDFPKGLIPKYDPDSYDILDNVVPDEKPMRDWANAAQGDYGRHLAGDKQFEEAFTNYMTEGYYNELNQALRTGADLSDDLYDTAATLHQAIYNDYAVFENDIPLYRGIEDAEGFFSRLKVGETFTDEGIISTSTNPLVSESFSLKYGDSTPYMLHIVLPKGFNGLALDPIASSYVGGSSLGEGMKEVAGFEYLNEVLLPPGTKFEVMEINQATSTIYMKVVGQSGVI